MSNAIFPNSEHPNSIPPNVETPMTEIPISNITNAKTLISGNTEFGIQANDIPLALELIIFDPQMVVLTIKLCPPRIENHGFELVLAL